MSQAGPVSANNSSGMSNVDTLTGNTGGAVGPDGLNNINVVGDGTTIEVAGDAGTNTLTISAIGGSGVTIDGDSGSATGSTITFTAHPSAGGSVTFSATSSTVTLNSSDSNHNTCVGSNSGSGGPITGTYNTAVGSGSLYKNTSGFGNIAIGGATLGLNTTGYENLAIGNNALFTSTGGLYNTAIGYDALYDLNGSYPNGSDNIAIGYEALADCTTGYQNLAIGDLSADALTTGYGNIVLGYDAGGNYGGAETGNILIGSAGVASESHTIHIGTQGSSGSNQNSCYIAGITGATPTSANHPQVVLCDNTGNLTTITSGTSGYVLTSNGASSTPSFQAAGGGGDITIAGDSGSTTYNSFTFTATTAYMGSTCYFHVNGSTVSLNVTDSNANTIIGKNAGNTSVSGSGNTSVGYANLSNLTSGGYNVALGDQALYGIEGGSSNIAIGYEALYSNQSNQNCIGIGHQALYTCTGSYIVAVGYQAGYSMTSGYDNVALGDSALYACQGGQDNIGIGTEALYSNTDGVENIAIGSSALYSVETGSDNIAIGYSALSTLSSGQSNICMGNGVASQPAFNGSSNIIIGNNGAENYTGTESYNILIGANGVTGDSNATRIANITGTTTGSSAVACLVDSNGQLGTTSSSLRYKTNIEDLGDISSRIYGLRPVKFNYKKHLEKGLDRKEYGLIAEEVNQIIPEIVVKNNAGEIDTLQYQHLPVFLLAEIQKLQRRIEALESKAK